MDVTTLDRPRAVAHPTTPAPRRSSGAPRAAVLAAVVALLVAAGWSWTSASQAVSPAGPGELGLVGGVVHVDGVLSAARPKHAMPGMGADNDPVAEDERRISVDVTLRADGDDPLEYAGRTFRLTPEGGTAQAPHKLVLPGEELPAGTQLSGTLIFDVPKDAQAGELSYGQESTPVVLPAEAAGPASAPAAPADAHGAGHG